MNARVLALGVGLIVLGFVGGTLDPANHDHARSAGCYVEPSRTAEGFEVIYYPRSVVHHVQGFAVPCPSR